jgi:hypothetical protein
MIKDLIEAGYVENILLSSDAGGSAAMAKSMGGRDGQEHSPLWVRSSVKQEWRRRRCGRSWSRIRAASYLRTEERLTRDAVKSEHSNRSLPRKHSVLRVLRLGALSGLRC